ncbi:MAG: hypothetical protein ACE5G0_00505 [Rhodothermales bacterium]
MDVRARAGIDIYGKELRYAEVEQRGPRYRLLRLGSCDFDFDVAEAVLQGTNTEYLEALTDALNDVFEGSVAARLHVTLHPPTCYSFFTPIPVDMGKEARKTHLLREAALLTRSHAPQPLRLTADPVYTETVAEGVAVEWFHVLALNEQLHGRFDRICRMLPQSRHRMTLSMHAVANAIERIERRDGGRRQDAPFTLALGWYPTHVEYTLCRHGRWYFSQYTDADAPDDCAYFALVLLDRLGLKPSSIGRIFTYGGYKDLDEFLQLGYVFPVAPESLNPLQLIDLDQGSMAAGFDHQVYAPCVGVAL